MWSRLGLTGARWRWRLWLQWAGASVLGSAVMWLLTQQFYPAIYQYLHKAPLRDGSPVYLSDFVALLSVGGIVAGAGQCFALRQHIVLNLWNVLVWLIGNVLSTLVPLGLVIDTTNPITIVTASAWIAGLLGFVVGAVQCIVLLDAMRWSGAWILASACAGAVGWPIGSYVQNLVAGHIDVGGYVVNMMLSGTLLALLLSQRQPIRYAAR